MTSFVALRVDAERLRATFIPQLVAKRLAKVEGPTGFPPLDVTVLDNDQPRHLSGRRLGADARSSTSGRSRWCSSKPSCTQLTAPDRHDRRNLAGAHRLRRSDDSRRSSRRAPGRSALMMAMLAGVMALGVFFVARAAAREVRVAELKSNFVSSVSHDLKTPLALIQLFAETLELGRLKNTDRAQEYYRIINSEARKLTRLINNLLDFSRIEAGLRSYRRSRPT